MLLAYRADCAYHCDPSPNQGSTLQAWRLARQMYPRLVKASLVVAVRGRATTSAASATRTAPTTQARRPRPVSRTSVAMITAMASANSDERDEVHRTASPVAAIRASLRPR